MWMCVSMSRTVGGMIHRAAGAGVDGACHLFALVRVVEQKTQAAVVMRPRPGRQHH